MNTKNKFLFIGGGVLILLVGIIIGSFFDFYSTPPEPASNAEVKAEIPPEQMNNITSLQPGQIIYGKVESKESNQITLSVRLQNPLDSKDVKILSVKIPIDPQKDEIASLKINTSTRKAVVAKLKIDDIKIGDYLTVKILTDKKVIYIP